MKIVVNRRYGGFGLSNEAIQMLIGCPHVELLEPNEWFGTNDPEVLQEKIKEHLKSSFRDGLMHEGKIVHDRHDDEGARTCERLVAVVQTLGDVANGQFAKLKVIEIPDDITYVINDYDGQETVHEQHRSW